MILLSIIRVLKFSFQDFFRNFWLTLVTLTILVLSLFSINFLIAVGVISETAINSVEDKIDLSLYLVPEASEADISVLKNELERRPGVERVTYISRQEALLAFRERHEGNAAIQEALREVGKNPLSPSLVVEAGALSDYETLIASLETLAKNDIIESRDFDDHKTLLTTMDTITERIRQTGFIVSLIFVLITIMVVFNAVRIAIYTHKKEIRIMKLVGASNWFIKAPFLAEGVLYSFVGVALAAALFYPFLQLLQPYLGTFFSADQFNLISYFNQNFLLIFGSQFAAAAAINLIASWFAVGKYARA